MTPNKDINKNPSNLYEWAIFYHQQWDSAVIPLREGKIPAVRWSIFQTQKPCTADYYRWFHDSKAWGIAIVCGEISGYLFRLDFDDPVDYQKLRDRLPEGTPVFRSQRPTGGYGAILRSSTSVPKLPEGTFKDYPKLGVNGEGSITVVPPTPGYNWLTQYMEIPVVDGQEFLRKEFGWEGGQVKRLVVVAGLTGKIGLEDAEVIALIQETREGSRNNTIVRLASYLRWRLVSIEIAKALLRPIVDTWSGEPICDLEFERTINSAYKYKEIAELSKEVQHATIRTRKSHKSRKRFL
jgi:hypothetical protein